MSSTTTINEPFQLYLSSTAAQPSNNFGAIYTTHNRDFPGYATVTAQSEGIHIWDLQNLHAVASYSVDKHVKFSIPAFSLYVTEDGTKSAVTYALIGLAPGFPKERRGRTIWVIRQNLSGPTISNEKTDVPVDVPPVHICGSGHPTAPLLFVSENGSFSLVDMQVNIKKQLDWPGERKHVETFLFPLKSCTFIHDDAQSCSSVAITCCRTRMALHVRLVLLGEEFIPLGTCEIPIASSTSDADIYIFGLTCSPSGVLSVIDSRGIWAVYQIMSSNSSVVSTPLSETLRLRRFSMLKSKKPSARRDFATVALNTSLVLLAAVVAGTQDISLQIWDLTYGVVLAAQSMPVPSEIPFTRLCLAIADKGQVLLTVSPSPTPDKQVLPKRSSIHIVPVDERLKSNIATALGKMALTLEWLVPKASNDEEAPGHDESAKIISDVQSLLKKKHAQKAERRFLTWVDSHSSKEAALGYEFVKKIFNMILPPEPTKYPYTSRITRCLLESAVVSTIMLNGRLITMLRERGDWENLMFALTRVADVSEDELMASAKFLVDRQRKVENAMDVDVSEGHPPPVWSYLFACISYPFSAASMRLAIRKHLPDAEDLVVILETLENWIRGGTEHEVDGLLKSVTTNMNIPSSEADSPPYPKVVMFLHAVLDASFVALLQYQPGHELLRRILSYIESEITFIDGLEPLREMLEPFARAQLSKEKAGASRESPIEWRKRRKQLEEQAGLSVGLYRLEELAI